MTSITAWTADQRSTKSKISARYPGWTFNVSFEEADQAFEKKGTEEAAVHQTRLRAVLDDIFSSDGNACVGTAVHSDNM